VDSLQLIVTSAAVLAAVGAGVGSFVTVRNNRRCFPRLPDDCIAHLGLEAKIEALRASQERIERNLEKALDMLAGRRCDEESRWQT
jgi:hypothetical protein